MTEINNDFYCSAGFWIDGRCAVCDMCESADHNDICEHFSSCPNRHRKFPTPEQFKEEYGFEWTGAVYWKWDNDPEKDWVITDRHHTEELAKVGDFNYIIICACTPFIPSSEWRSS